MASGFLERGTDAKGLVRFFGARRRGQIAETVRAAEWPLGQAELDAVAAAHNAFRQAIN